MLSVIVSGVKAVIRKIDAVISRRASFVPCRNAKKQFN
jgi:hypothetical protein